MGVRRVAGDVADDAEVPVWGGESFSVDERGDGFGEVDAVDEDVTFDYLRKGPALGRLVHVPAEDVAVGNSCLGAEIDGAAAAAAKSANDEDSRRRAGNLDPCREFASDGGEELVLVGKGLHAGHAALASFVRTI